MTVSAVTHQSGRRRPKRTVRAWTVKSNSKDRPEGEWYWDDYFNAPEEQEYTWDWLRDPRSLKYIREDVHEGDILLCYQVNDGRRIFGLTSVHSLEPMNDGTRFLVFAPSNRSFRFESPITVDQLREHEVDPECFRQGSARGLHPISSTELHAILEVVQTLNPNQAPELAMWLDSAQGT